MDDGVNILDSVIKYPGSSDILDEYKFELVSMLAEQSLQVVGLDV